MRSSSTLFVIGVNGPHAPVAERDGAVIGAADIARVAAAIRASGADEAAVLCTGDRTECYVVAGSERAAIDALSRGLVRSLGADPFRVGAGSVVDRGRAAARHLLRVAGGLESRVPGDVQVIGQVRYAYDAAKAGRSVGPLLHRLFQGALAVVRHDPGVAVRASALPDVERLIDDELARIDDWRVRREALATVMA